MFVCICMFLSITESNIQLCIILVTCDMDFDVIKHHLKV